MSLRQTSVHTGAQQAASSTLPTGFCLLHLPSMLSLNSSMQALQLVAHLQENTKHRGWWEWPEEIRMRHPAAVAQAITTHKTDIDRFIALQFLFDRQWKAVKVKLLLGRVHLCHVYSVHTTYCSGLHLQRSVSGFYPFL